MADPVVQEVQVVAPRQPQPQHGLRTFKPQIKITLLKNVTRQSPGGSRGPVAGRFDQAASKVDLTPYLGQGCACAMRRSVRGGAGDFTVTLNDRIVQGQDESLYGLIEPMDAIEIRMARSPLSTDLPIVFRGFVGTVRRNSTMTMSGPQRQVILQGHDYGKILQIIRVFYLSTMDASTALLSSFKFYLKYGASGDSKENVSQLMQDVLDNVVNDGTADAPGFLARMRNSNVAATESPVVNIIGDFRVTDGTVSPWGVNNWPQGAIFDLLNYFGDVGPWNELYVEDRPAGPYLVHRPNPFKDADGNYVIDGAAADTIDVDENQLVALSVARSDEGVANFFIADGPDAGMVGSTTMQLAANGGTLDPPPALVGYKNADPDTYGQRLMVQNSQQFDRLDGKPEDEVKDGRTLALNILDTKRRYLQDQNKDNVVLESGSMTLRGNENLKAGMYVRLTRGGGFQAEYYAVTVAHEFVMGDRWVTDVEFERGTGYIERLQKGTGASSAYYSEMSLRGAYPDG